MNKNTAQMGIKERAMLTVFAIYCAVFFPMVFGYWFHVWQWWYYGGYCLMNGSPAVSYGH